MTQRPMCHCEACNADRPSGDDLRWLALLIRQGLKIIVVGIERRYGLREATQDELKAVRRERQSS